MRDYRATIESLKRKWKREEEGAARLRAELEAKSAELEKLRANISAQSPDTSEKEAQTETTVSVDEMRDDRREEQPPPPARVEDHQHLLHAMEFLVEKKMKEVMAGLASPSVVATLEAPRREVQPPRRSRAAMTTTTRKDSATTAAEEEGASSTAREVPARKRMTRRRRVPTLGVPTPQEGTAWKRRKKKVWPDPPSSEAVMLTVPPGGKTSYAEVLRAAQNEMSLEVLGIPGLTIRRARAGGYLMGVSCEDAKVKADKLADGLGRLAERMGAKVTRPSRTMDIRVTGLQEDTVEEDVVGAIARCGGCNTADIRCGRVRGTPLGVSLWMKCPMAAAIKVAKLGKVKVGWALVDVEALKPRPQRCYRCLEIGHFRAACTSERDRSGQCYRCSETGHSAAMCRARVPRCPLCKDAGREQGHVLGGPGCDVLHPPPPSDTRTSIG